jgi:hypothetical protein
LGRLINLSQSQQLSQRRHGDTILDSDFHDDDCTTRKATTIKLLDEALNLIAITNQVIDDVTTTAATKTKHNSVEDD